MRAALVLIVALIIAAPLAWLAGEAHRENCIRAGNRACSVLPWEAGKPKPKAPTRGENYWRLDP